MPLIIDSLEGRQRHIHARMHTQTHTNTHKHTQIPTSWTNTTLRNQVAHWPAGAHLIYKTAAH